MTPSSCRLLIFGKHPVPGRAKTRLAPLLGSEGAAALYQAFLEDTIAAARKIEGVSLELWLEPGAAKRGSPVVPSVDQIRWQEGLDLGSRLSAAFRRAFQEGAERVVIVGSDHPTLPVEFLASAFEQLGEFDLVLGPSRDGGYYLVGIGRGAWPASEEVFREIPWSTSHVLSDTRKRALELGLAWNELPTWYDVDEPGDLERLKRDVSPESRTAVALRTLLSAARS